MISNSPLGEKYNFEIDYEDQKNIINHFVNLDRKTIVVQGLGFVGSAMVAALSNVQNSRNEICYNVIGVDLPDTNNYWKIARINKGKPPVISTDTNVDNAFSSAFRQKNLIATYSPYAYTKADVVVVDIQLDINKKELGNSTNYFFSYEQYLQSLRAVAENIKEETLIVIETTVPPGTTEKVVYPLFKDIFSHRGLDINKVYFSHSYERVMPGANYLNSIINYYRVYSGLNNESKLIAKEFLKSFINTESYPLYEMHSTNASEMAKVMENTYRAVNIALLQEWTEFAEMAEVNLFEVINAIRVRETHKNIMSPGFGVGGYCLTKDSLLADWAYINNFSGSNHLNMSLNAIAINDLMPTYTFNLIKRNTDTLAGKKVTLLGISYLNDVADTRYSPSYLFYDLCLRENAVVQLHDPIVRYWEEKKIEIDTNINNIKNYDTDIAVFAVKHSDYLSLSAEDIRRLLTGVKLIIDANNVIDDKKALELMRSGIKVIGVGKGHWTNLKTDL